MDIIAAGKRCHSSPALASAPTKSSALSVREEWVRCIAPGMRPRTRRGDQGAARVGGETSIGLARFRREARILASLNRPTSAASTDSSTERCTSTGPELVEGALRDMLTAAERRLPVDQRDADCVGGSPTPSMRPIAGNRSPRPETGQRQGDAVRLVKLLDFGLGRGVHGSGRVAADSMAATANTVPVSASRKSSWDGRLHVTGAGARMADPERHFLSGDRAVRMTTGRAPASACRDDDLRRHPPGTPTPPRRSTRTFPPPSNGSSSGSSKRAGCRFASATEVEPGPAALEVGAGPATGRAATMMSPRSGGSSRRRRCGGDMAAIAGVRPATLDYVQ